jgi:hypothetical protein
MDMEISHHISLFDTKNENAMKSLLYGEIIDIRSLIQK